MSAVFGWSTEPLVEGAAGRLLEASLWGGALAVGVWALCALVPGVPAAWRRWLWWAVSLKLLLGLAPLPPVVLPVLAPPSAPAVAAALPTAGASHADAILGARELGGKARSADRAPAPAPSPALVPTPAAPGLAVRLLSALVAAWALGAALSLLAAAGEAFRAARLVRRASPPADPGLSQRFARLAAELGTPRARLRLSPEVETPQLTGILRPTVLLPARATTTLAAPELEMAIAHELVHVRQHDLLVGMVPALAARLFFFHPLARLAAREHALAREAVCDAAVVGRFAPSPRDYGRLLLRLSLPNRAPLRAAVAAAAHHTLHRRLQMLLQPPRRTRAPWAWLAGAAALAVLVPFQLTAAEPDGTAAGTAPAAAVVEAAPATPAPVPQAPVMLGMLAPAPLSHDESAAERSADDEADRDEEDDALDAERRAFLLSQGDGHIMSGDRRDMERANRWRRDGEELLWFRRDGREWVIRDAALLARAAELWAPQTALGERQAALGERQAELGEQQAELGRQQAELGAQQAEVAAQQAELSARLAELNAREARLSAREHRADEAERRELREQRRQIDAQRDTLTDEMRELHRAIAELGDQQGELGAQQGALGSRQGELGDQQGELGREQGRLARIAERELWKLLDEAVAAGRAQRVE